MARGSKAHLDKGAMARGAKHIWTQGRWCGGAKRIWIQGRWCGGRSTFGYRGDGAGGRRPASPDRLTRRSVARSTPIFETHLPNLRPLTAPTTRPPMARGCSERQNTRPFSAVFADTLPKHVPRPGINASGLHGNRQLFACSAGDFPDCPALLVGGCRSKTCRIRGNPLLWGRDLGRITTDASCRLVA